MSETPKQAQTLTADHITAGTLRVAGIGGLLGPALLLGAGLKPFTAAKIEADMIEARNARQTQCNECGRLFVPDLIAETTPKGEEYQHFTCPSCGQDYPVALITAHGVGLRGALETAERLAGERNSQEWRSKAERLKRQFAREVRKNARPTE